MSKRRLEAFSDGVIAILITIMVLELHIPAGTSWHALGHELPAVLAYVLSFVYLGIYWNNHHHMLAAVSRVSGAVLWANLHLLFWLSLIPFSTAWMSEHRFPPIPTAIYGIVLLADAIAYLILQTALLRVRETTPVCVPPLAQMPRAKSQRSCTASGSGWRSSTAGSAWRCTSPWHSSGWYPTAASSAT